MYVCMYGAGYSDRVDSNAIDIVKVGGLKETSAKC